MILLVITISCLSLLFAVYLARYVLRHDMGTDKMQEISNAIKEGAEAFLSRQNRTIILFSSVLAVLIFLLYAFVRTPSPADPVPPVQMAFWTTFSFVLGALCSVIAGYVGMWVSIRANIRTAAAVRSSLNEALKIAMRGGAVSGLFVVAMSLLGVGGLYALLELFGTRSAKDSLYDRGLRFWRFLCCSVCATRRRNLYQGRRCRRGSRRQGGSGNPRR